MKYASNVSRAARGRNKNSENSLHNFWTCDTFRSKNFMLLPIFILFIFPCVSVCGGGCRVDFFVSRGVRAGSALRGRIEFARIIFTTSYVHMSVIVRVRRIICVWKWPVPVEKIEVIFPNALGLLNFLVRSILHITMLIYLEVLSLFLRVSLFTI